MVSGGSLRNSDSDGFHLAILPGLHGLTQSAAADFASLNNNRRPRFGVILRFQDSLNYYLLYRQAGPWSRLTISKFINGRESVLATARIDNPPENSFFQLKGRAEGTTLTLEVDGAAQLSVADSTFTAGSPGIVLGSRFALSNRADNFIATVHSF
jgi:hypothetical protein